MSSGEEFYVGYSGQMGRKTKKKIRLFLVVAFILIAVVGFSFSYFQKTAVNSSFEYDTPTELSGIYHESPYPMLRIELAENTFKDLVLLGFGKNGPRSYLDEFKREKGEFIGKQITISGNLIYYNGKTLVQLEEEYELSVDAETSPEQIVPKPLGSFTIHGEVVDPKCYFGVMKPGYGKIHRSCASLCIAGGIPPVLVAEDEHSNQSYYLLTDLKGKAIHRDILPYIGQPAVFKGDVYQLGEWLVLRIDISDIKKLDKNSSIY